MLIPIDKYELTCILNHLIDCEPFSAVIHAPLQDLDLFELAIAKDIAITAICDKQSFFQVFDELRNWYNDRGDRYSIRDFPNWSTFQSCLLMSGVTTYTNIDQIKAELIGSLNRDIMRGHPSASIAFDTNIFRDRFYSAFIEEHDELRHLPFSFVLSDATRDELTFSYKFNERDLDNLSAHPMIAGKHDILEHFWNQNKLADRQQRLGFIEYTKIQNKRYFHPCVASEDKNQSPDVRIIRSYQSFASIHRHVVLISRDADFIALAQGLPGISPLRAECNPDPSLPVLITWDHLVELIYVLAIVFGCVDFTGKGGRGLRCFGIYRGKAPEDWQEERIAIVPNNLDLNEPIRDIEISRQLGPLPDTVSLRTGETR